MKANSSRKSKSACGDRNHARIAWMTPNAASSAVTTGGTFSIGSEGVFTPNVRRARRRDIGGRPHGGKRMRASVVDLKFLPFLRHPLRRNLKSALVRKFALERAAN